MSLLGDTVDTFISTLNSIITIIINAIGGIGGIITGILHLFSLIISFLYYIYLFLDVIVTLLLNPEPLLMVILGSGFWYSAFTASTRKDMLIKLGIFYKYVFETSAKLLYSAYTIVVRLIVGIIDII